MITSKEIISKIKQKRANIPPVLYYGKYGMISHIPPPEKTTEEEIIDFFTHIFGDKLTLVKVYQYHDIDKICKTQNITKKYILNIIKKHLEF